MIYNELLTQVKRGMEGMNFGIPITFSRLKAHVGIRKSMYFLIGGQSGCTSSTTKIEISRANNFRGPRIYTIEQLYYKFHGKRFPREKGDKGNGHDWDLSIPTKTISYKHDLDQVGYNEIVDVVQSGVKELFLVKTESGKEIKTTKDHKYLIDKQNNFKPLEELKVGDFVFIRKYEKALGRNPRPSRQELQAKMPYYSSTTNLKHRFDSMSFPLQRIKKYRAIYDAGLNNISLEEFLEEVKTNPNHTLVFSDPTMDIHHKDEDPSNNAPSNLQLLTKAEHSALHNNIHAFKNRDIVEDRIVSIESIGEEMTYDICMKDPYNNFVADGIFVHNSGKTTLTDQLFVLDPLDWLQSVEGVKSGITLKVIYFSMERNHIFKFAKWVSLQIFKDYGKVIPMTKILGWIGGGLSDDELKIFESYKSYLERIEDIVTVYSGQDTPVGVTMKIKQKLSEWGEFEKTEKGLTYIPEDPNQYVIIIIDHIGLLKKTKDLTTEKDAIDMLSNELQKYRDVCGCIPVVVSQFNRELANIHRIKQGNVTPTQEDFKSSGNPIQDADVVFTLFDPMRYGIDDDRGYKLDKLVDDKGNRYYRQFKVVKNSYGADDLVLGIAFMGVVGLFKELIRKKDMIDSDYDDIVDNSYFKT